MPVPRVVRRRLSVLLAVLVGAAGVGALVAPSAAAAHTATFSVDRAIPGFVYDVAVGSGGTVWAVTSDGAFQASGSQVGVRQIPIFAQRVAVDPDGLPWFVDFAGRIWQGHADGTSTQMPGAARDIAIGPDGIPWIIGTNFRNSSFQVWHWTGVEWTPDAGSGQEIDVDANSEPVVNGADDKIWVRNGGPDQGWSRITGKALDMGALNSVNGNGLWIVGTDHRVWNLTNGVWDRSDTPSTTQIAVTPGGVPWTVDAAGELNIGSVR